MKILIFNWQDIRNPLAGGAEVHLHEIFSRVAARGHEVTLFCSSFPGAPTGEENVRGIRVIREGGRFLFNFHVYRRYRRRFAREGYDVVLDDMNKIPFFTPLYVREPLAIIIHHLFGKSIFREAAFPLALYVYCAERLGVRVARFSNSRLWVVSPSTREEMLREGFPASALEIVQNCVDHERHRPDPARRSPIPLVGYFGRLKRYKSADHLLQAFVSLRKAVPEIRLVVVGEGDHRPRLEALARELGIAGAVRFTGFVDEETKVRLLQEMWFTVNTSAKEGWGLTVIEANACGTPVIGADVPGLRDAIRDSETGLLYPYGDIGKLAEAMNRLIHDGSLRNRLAEGAVQWASTFHWETVAEKVISLLERRISTDA